MFFIFVGVFISKSNWQLIHMQKVFLEKTAKRSLKHQTCQEF
jgi:hypothetical protein